MRLFHERKQKREAWMILCSLCSILAFIQLNHLIYLYPEPLTNLEVQNHLISQREMIFQNQSILKFLNISKIDPTVLQLVTAAQHIDTLVEKHHKPKVIGSRIGSARFSLNFSIEEALQYGHFKPKRGFLTIAIPSIKREGFNYLYDTIDSLLKQSSEADKEIITIVIMFSDEDDEWNADRALNVSVTYDEHVSSGLIQVIILPHQNYPDFELLPRTYNDSIERLKWRSKQNIHYAFLFRYCQNISDYYMHLEDDVKAAKYFIRDVKSYPRIKKNDWFLIRFSSMGFIGVFFRSTDLLTISDFFLLFYAVQPCDFLMNIIANIKLQPKEIRFRPSLFQHHGIVSSLKNKRQVIIDRTFKGGSKLRRLKKIYNINPPAEIDTTMVAFENYKAKNAYLISDLYFWAVSPQKGQTYTIVLNEPHTLKAIIVVGGYPTKKNDIIIEGELQVSSLQHCSEWTTLGKLSRGSFDTTKIKKLKQEHLQNVTCVQIEVTNTQTIWAIISEIALLKP